MNMILCRIAILYIDYMQRPQVQILRFIKKKGQFRPTYVKIRVKHDLKFCDENKKILCGSKK